jgi:hypothetical protein
MIVKPYEYIIGRLRGEFSPGDPGIYRSNRRNQTTSSVYNQPIQTKNNERTNSRIHTDVLAHESYPPNFVNTVGSQGRNPISGGPQRPVKQETPYDSNIPVERKLKLEELRSLLFKNYPPQVANQILVQIIYLAEIANDDAFLDYSLNFQRTRFGSA